MNSTYGDHSTHDNHDDAFLEWINGLFPVGILDDSQEYHISLSQSEWVELIA